jgi:hypothetical protein
MSKAQVTQMTACLADSCTGMASPVHAPTSPSFVDQPDELLLFPGPAISKPGPKRAENKQRVSSPPWSLDQHKKQYA